MAERELTVESTIREIFDRAWRYQSLFAEGEVWRGSVVAAKDQRELESYARACGLEGLDLAGRSFLDVGCMEGLLSFWAEGQGAEPVLAVDGFVHRRVVGGHLDDVPLTFHLVRRLRRSKVQLLVQDVESAEFPEAVGLFRERFDIVLCAGVLYHLINPLRGLRNLYAVTGEMAVVACPDWRPLQADGRVFTPHPALGETAAGPLDTTITLRHGEQNPRLWNFGPEDIEAMLRFAGFRSVDRTSHPVLREIRQHVFYCTP